MDSLRLAQERDVVTDFLEPGKIWKETGAPPPRHDEAERRKSKAEPTSTDMNRPS